MNEWTLKIEEKPKAKGRVAQKNGKRFSDPKTRIKEAIVRMTAKAAWNRPPLPKGEPVSLVCMFGFVRPASHYMGNDPARGLRMTGKKPAPLRHTQKPDVDNLVKLIKDALNGVVWWDDAQVDQETAQKVWLEEGPNRTEIIVSWE